MTDIIHTEFIAVKAVQEDDGTMKLLVLGAPYRGHLGGKDAYGEYFSDKTDFMLDIGDKRPVIYYHGLNPNGEPEKLPEAIGVATAVKRDEQGLWFEVAFSKVNSLVKRVIEAARKGLAKASSGAVAHLVRKAMDGEILTWPIGELSLFDIGGDRQPANQLAVAIPLKAHFDETSLSLPQAFAEGCEPQADATGSEYQSTILENLGETKMDTNEVVNEVLSALDAREAARKAEQERLEAVKAEAKAEALKEYEAKMPAWKGGFSTKKVTELGDKNDAMKAYLHWVKTGDELAYRAAAPMNGDTAANGGYAVPDDHLAEVIAKRDEKSIPRLMGARVIQTSRDVINIPVEDGEMGAFAIVSEGGDVTTSGENEPTLGQVAVTIYTFRNLVKISSELLEDDGSNLEQFLLNSFARKWAEAENKYSLVGTGSAQPQGVFYGGTAGLTLDDDVTIAATEIPELYYKLAQPYRDGSCWVMKGETEGFLRGLNGANHFYFGQQTIPGTSGPIGWETLMNRPVFNNSNVAIYSTASNKSLLIGNFEFYGLVERRGMVVQRLVETYAGTGQIGLLASVRFGGAVLQAEAFQYATQAAA